jgi:hypothetical protein
MFLARLMLSSLALAGVLVMGLSSPASAATGSVTNNGNGTATVTYSTTTDTEVHVCSGATTEADCGNGNGVLYLLGAGAQAAPPLPGDAANGGLLLVAQGIIVEVWNSSPAAVTALPEGTYTIVLWPGGQGSGSPLAGVRNVTISSGVPNPSPATFDAMVSPLVQQVPMPVSDTCSEVDDEQFAWGTGLRGGWSKSWAQWANDGLGGPVCTRTLVYSGSWQIS